LAGGWHPVRVSADTAKGPEDWAASGARSDEWSYAQESTLAINGQKTNDVVSQGLAVNPQPTPALYRSYYNRDRLNAAYLEQHLDRLREAWLKYKTDLSH